MLDFLQHTSYLGLALWLVLCGVGLPVPEEVPVCVAGTAAANGAMDPWFAFLACLVGAIGGDSVMYWIGYFFGRNVLRDHPRIAGYLTPAREEQLEVMIKRHAVKTLVICRFMIGVRSAVYLTAGILHVPYRYFLLVDSLCATVVVSIFFGLSYLFGEQILNLIRRSETIFTLVAVLLLILVLCLYYYRKKRQAALPDPLMKYPEETASEVEVDGTDSANGSNFKPASNGAAASSHKARDLT